MNVLFLAPQPFYQERGTPIAVRLLLRALSERGDEVDLLTFPEGEDVIYPGLRIHRARTWPPVRGIGPGFSWKKVYGDLFLGARAFSLVRRTRPDVIHATEEGVFLARALGALFGIPFVYDMDSVMSRQIADRFPIARSIAGVLGRIEADTIRRARVVVPMCDALAERALADGAREIVVLKDVSLLGEEPAAPDPDPSPDGEVGEAVASGRGGPAAPPGPGARSAPSILRFRDDPALSPGKIVLYVGNLEPYQGIDLLLEAFARAQQTVTEAGLVVVGGVREHVDAYRRLAEQRGLGPRVRFPGPQPVAHLGALLAQADLLVSPRIHGENTPMKLYTYLDSGVAVLATDLPTHTQVVGPGEAFLAPPEPEAFARAMAEALTDDVRRAQLAAAARELIRREHSYEGFRARVHDLYGRLAEER